MRPDMKSKISLSCSHVKEHDHKFGAVYLSVALGLYFRNRKIATSSMLWKLQRLAQQYPITIERSLLRTELLLPDK